jgi:DNA-binding transcriptional ArsR family regulator
MPLDPLSTTFAALADPTRRAILSRLALGEISVMELAKPFDMSLPAISRHLKVLERAGLIARGREAQWRPCRIAPVSLRQVDGWLGNFRKFWDENFSRLDGLLEEMKAEEKAKQAARKPVRKPVKPASRSKPKVGVKKEKHRGRKNR